jgi:hypothetical protein
MEEFHSEMKRSPEVANFIQCNQGLINIGDWDIMAVAVVQLLQ